MGYTLPSKEDVGSISTRGFSVWCLHVSPVPVPRVLWLPPTEDMHVRLIGKMSIDRK